MSEIPKPQKRQPKPRKPISKSKKIDCKTCGTECNSGKRGLCDKCYQKEQLEKEKARVKTAKLKEKKAKIREKKASSISKLTKTLDQVFSKFIRLRDTDERGVGYCIDCGERMEWKNIQCGHFMSRRLLSVRWDEMNCAAQKDGCNMFQQGRQFEFAKGLDARYGDGTADLLLTRSREIKKWTSDELKSLIQHYNEKCKELESRKTFITRD